MGGTTATPQANSPTTICSLSSILAALGLLAIPMMIESPSVKQTQKATAETAATIRSFVRIPTKDLHGEQRQSTETSRRHRDRAVQHWRA
jgi:hypothetical protein